MYSHHYFIFVVLSSISEDNASEQKTIKEGGDSVTHVTPRCIATNVRSRISTSPSELMSASGS